MDHPEELSRVAGLQRKVDEVKNVMVDNIEQAWPCFAARLSPQLPCAVQQAGVQGGPVGPDRIPPC